MENKVTCAVFNSVSYWQNVVGKCADIALFDTGSGLAEIKAVNGDGIDLQWICMSPCYASQVYGEDMYTESHHYAFDMIASCKNVMELEPMEIQNRREEFMKEDAPIFERYHALEHERCLAKTDPLEYLAYMEQKYPDKKFRICNCCKEVKERQDMNFTKDCHGIPMRLVCNECYSRIMSHGYDGVYYDETMEQIDSDY